MANVVFDEQSAARIAKSVKWTEQFTDPTDGDPLGETDLAGEANNDGGQTVIRGTFTGEWAKDTDKDVDFTADNGDSKTKTATNYFADVGESGVTSACCIIQAGSEWILIAAECG